MPAKHPILSDGVALRLNKKDVVGQKLVED
jgi:hypothetical protein